MSPTTSQADDRPDSTASAAPHPSSPPPIGSRISPKRRFLGSFTPDFLQQHVRARITTDELLALPERQRRPLRETLGLTKGEVDCYAVIQRQVIYRGVAKFSNAQLAMILKVKPRMVRYYIAHLVQLSLIEKVSITGQCNQYFVLEHAWMHESFPEPGKRAHPRDATEENRPRGWQSSAREGGQSSAREGWQSTATILEKSDKSNVTETTVSPPFPPIEDRGEPRHSPEPHHADGEDRATPIPSDHRSQPSHAKRVNPRARGDNPRAIARKLEQQRGANSVQPPAAEASVPESVSPVQLPLPLFDPNDSLYVQAGEIARTEAEAAGIKPEYVSQDRIRNIYQELHERPERGTDTAQQGVEALWHYVLQEVRARVDPTKYGAWLEPLTPLSVAGDVLHIAVQSKFVCDWMREHYHALLVESVQRLTGKPYQVTFVVEEPLNGTG